MAVPPGSRLTLDFTSPLSPPAGDNIPLAFTYQGPPPVGVGLGDSSQIGAVGIRLRSQFVVVPGGDYAAFPDPLKSTLTVKRAGIPLAPSGWDSARLQAPTYVRWRQYVVPPSLPFSLEVLNPQGVRLAGGYQPAPGVNVILNFAEPLVPPPGSAVVLEFGALGYTQVNSATVGNSARFGQPDLYLPEQVRPESLGVQTQFGIAKVEGNIRYINLNTSIDPPPLGTPFLTKKATALLASPFVATLFGTAYTWNLRQYLRPSGTAMQSAGTPFLIGGVKFVTPAGIGGSAIGTAKVVNTTANQNANPSGIAAPAMTSPVVSPRTLYVSGIGMGGWGLPLVQNMPLLIGWQNDGYGTPAIDYKTKYLTPSGMAQPAESYPRVFYRNQWLYPSAALEAGLFGDGVVVNRTRRLTLTGLAAPEITGWTLLYTTRRPLLGNGWDSQGWGGVEIWNKSPSLAPPGFDALTTPSPAETGIGYWLRTLQPTGMLAPIAGTPIVVKTPELAPKGFTGAMGQPEIERRLRFLEVLGADSAKFGGAALDYRSRYLLPGGVAQDGYGNQGRVEHGRRWLDQLGALMGQTGSPTVGNRNKTILPAAISTLYASAHMVGGTRWLRPEGLDATRFGARIIPEIQAVYVQGMIGTVGLAYLFNQTQQASPRGFITVGQQPADRWGTGRVFNRRQFVTLTYDPVSDLNPPQWPYWTQVENHNRTLRVTGQELAAAGYPQIDNKASPLRAAGIPAPATDPFYLAGMVSHRVRSFRLEGLEPPYFAGWATVYNDARVIGPEGANGSGFGIATAVNTRRYYQWVGAFDAAVLGYPMVADRIRYLDFEGRYSISPPYIQLPEVKLHTRYVEPRGNDMSRVGGVNLDIHWTIIAPKWTLQNLYGSPFVWNWTPELHQGGRNHEEFGNPFVRLQWRPVAPIGDEVAVYGKPMIAFRDRSFSVTGWRSWQFGLHKVVRLGAPPYSTQYIYLDSVPNPDDPTVTLPGYGIAPVPKQVGEPIMNQQVIYVPGENEMVGYGRPNVIANSIRVEPGYWELLEGKPMVTNWIRPVEAKSIDSQIELGKPRLSPHTIYAVVEASLQARFNHPLPSGSIGLHYVDGYGKPPGVALGTPLVVNQHRWVYVSTDYFGNTEGGRYGTPNVELALRYVAVNGFNTFRMGWHRLPELVIAEVFDNVDQLAMGRPTVKRPVVVEEYQEAKPSGLPSLTFGGTRIELFNRNLPTQGFNSMAMGTRKLGDTPYQWQGLRLGPLIPNIPTGFNAELVGKPWASYRVRELRVTGDDEFSSEYQLEAFGWRLTVKRGGVTVPARQLTPVGIDGFATNASDVRPGTYFIRPDGNADQHRKGAF